MNYQNQWNNDNSYILSSADSLALESLANNSDCGIASIKAKAMLERIGKEIRCPNDGSECDITNYEEYGNSNEDDKAKIGNHKNITYESRKIQSDVNNNEIIINVHPNPANNMLYIKLNKFPQTSVNYTLYDIQGKELLSGSFEGQKHEVNISQISTGIYFIPDYALAGIKFKLMG